jgi:Domain of unknown function (DUF4326)
MPDPMVVHVYRGKFDVYVGRGQWKGEAPGWGNPVPLEKSKDSPEERRAVLRAYAEWLVGQDALLERIGELSGKRLGCWCAPKKCHGEILARLARLGSAKERKAQLELWLAKPA